MTNGNDYRLHLYDNLLVIKDGWPPAENIIDRLTKIIEGDEWETVAKSIFEDGRRGKNDQG